MLDRLRFYNTPSHTQNNPTPKRDEGNLELRPEIPRYRKSHTIFSPSIQFNVASMSFELPSLTLLNFIWFLVFLNVIMFTYIQLSIKRQPPKIARRNSSFLGHWGVGLSYLLVSRNVVKLGHKDKDTTHKKAEQEPEHQRGKIQAVAPSPWF